MSRAGTAPTRAENWRHAAIQALTYLDNRGKVAFYRFGEECVRRAVDLAHPQAIATKRCHS